MENVIELQKDNTQEELRGKIMQLEAHMKEMVEHQIHIEPKHYFANGLYAREIFIPKGVLLTGFIHKTEHLCVLSLGEVTVYTDDGMKRLKASTVVHSSPGTKRALFAHEDSVWINFHHNPTNETDLEKIEQIYTTDNYADYYLQSARSFNDVLLASCVNADEMNKISNNKEDFDDSEIPLINVSKSDIHGLGAFCMIDVLDGSIIGLARMNGLRTILGKYCNHSATPNCEMDMLDDGSVVLVAKCDISSGDELTVDYYFSFKNTRIENLNKEIA